MEFSSKRDSELTFLFQFQIKFISSSFTSFTGSASGFEQTSQHV